MDAWYMIVLLYVRILVCVYIRARVCACTYKELIRAYIDLPLYGHMHTHVYTCMYTGMYMCMYTCNYVYAQVL